MDRAAGAPEEVAPASEARLLTPTPTIADHNVLAVALLDALGAPSDMTVNIHRST